MVIREDIIKNSLSFFSGALLFCTFTIVQGFFLGFAIVVKSFLLWMLFGGICGLIGGRWYAKCEVCQTHHKEVVQDITERKQAEEALLKHANERLAALYKVAQLITAQLRLETVLDTIAHSTAELLKTDTGVILLLDESGEFLRIRGAYGLSEHIVKNTRDRIGESIAGRVVQSGKPIIANDLPNNPVFDNPAVENEELLACASVPLRIGSKIIGTLDVHSKTKRQAFDETYIEILTMLANQAAIAIENARLYDELRTARDELELRVQQRTNELLNTNERLRHEIAERKRVEKALADERNLLRTLIDNMPDYIYVKNTQSQFLAANNAVTHVMGAKIPEELLGKTDFDFYPRELAEQYYGDEQVIINSGKPLINHEEPLIDQETRISKWLLTTKIPFRDSQGNIIGLVGIGRDITERKRSQEILQRYTHELVLLNRMSELFETCQQEEDTYQVISEVCTQLFPEDAGGCLYLLDDSQTFIKPVSYWGNLPFHPETCPLENCQIFNTGELVIFEHPETNPFCPHLKLSPDTAYLCAPIMAPEENLGVLTLYFPQKEPEQSEEHYAHMLVSKRMVVPRVVEHYALSLVNLRLREKLRWESIRDSLTGLYNRRYMEAALEQEASRIKRHNTLLGIIMLDVDHFKEFNDTHGHQAGDLILQEIGSFLRDIVRGEDVACRYGGEEFLLIMSGTSLKIAEQRAKGIWAKLRDLKVEFAGKTLSITVSAGVAALPFHGPGVMDVVRFADDAVYQAKAKGRDQVVVAAYGREY